LGVGAYCLIKLLLPKKNKSNLPILALISILFNPALIFVSALWGQVDVIPLTFIVWSFYFLSKGSHRFSVFLMSLALLSKQTAVLAVPFYLLFFVNKLSVKKIVESLMIGYLTFVAIYFPFQKTIIEKIFPFISYMKTATMFASNKVSMHAYNFWQMIMPGANDNNVRSVAQIIVGAFLFFVIYKTWKKRENITQVIAGSAVFSLFSFIFLTRMHERHLAIVLPLFLIASVLDFKFYWIFIFESIYFLINMYAAWPILGIDFLRITLNSPAVVNVLVIMQLGVLILTVILWTKTLKQKS
jgi:Gpi18-like mannosyltransferase